MDKIVLQARLDVLKWLDSEYAHTDKCGSYDYCAYCNKEEVMPCANAFQRMNQKELDDVPFAEVAADDTVAQVADDDSFAEVAPIEQPIATPVQKKADKPRVVRTKKEKAPIAECVAELDSSLGKKFDIEKVLTKKATRKSLTFAEKFALADDIIKERYEILKQALTTTPKGTPKIKSRISKQCDTYRREGDIVAKVTIIGTSLRINLPLDPFAEEFCDGRTPHVATGHKKVYEYVPFQFKVNSKLALKRALALIELVK